MKECRECDLAVYCYSESGTWIFRTKQEMEEKRAAMNCCPLFERVRQGRPETAEAQCGQKSGG